LGGKGASLPPILAGQAPSALAFWLLRLRCRWQGGRRDVGNMI
jgi:hypothetical protein